MLGCSGIGCRLRCSPPCVFSNPTWLLWQQHAACCQLLRSPPSRDPPCRARSRRSSSTARQRRCPGRATCRKCVSGDSSACSVPNNRTFFFYDGLQPRGLAYEFMTEFVNTLNAGKSTNATGLRIVSAILAGPIHPGHREWVWRRRNCGSHRHRIAREASRLHLIRPHDERDRRDGSERAGAGRGGGSGWSQCFRASIEQLLRESHGAQ